MLRLSNSYCRTLLKLEGAHFAFRLEAPDGSANSMVLVLEQIRWWDLTATQCLFQRCNN